MHGSITPLPPYDFTASSWNKEADKHLDHNVFDLYVFGQKWNYWKAEAVLSLLEAFAFQQHLH